MISSQPEKCRYTIPAHSVSLQALVMMFCVFVLVVFSGTEGHSSTVEFTRHWRTRRHIRLSAECHAVAGHRRHVDIQPATNRR